MKIVLIGAGNVGYHLGKKLNEVGEEVIQVFSRKRTKAKRLATLINATATTSLNKISPEADLYILAVSDDAIEEVANFLFSKKNQNKLVVHTSGATPIKVFENIGLKRFGVFYPLQTFSVDKKPDFENIPFCINANNKSDVSQLKKMAKRLSRNVNVLNDDQRVLLHVAAVFANNFSNHLFHISDVILKSGNMKMDLLTPLIEETVNKIKKETPKEMQTGPALRGDEKTIKRHMELLKPFPEYRKIYNQLTKSIQKL